MEYLEGQTLEQVLSGRPMEMDSLLRAPLKSPTVSTPHTQKESSTEISSRPRFSSPIAARQRLWTLAWPRLSPAVAMPAKSPVLTMCRRQSFPLLETIRFGMGEKLLSVDLADDSFQLSAAEWVAQAVICPAAHGLKVVFPFSNSGKNDHRDVSRRAV